MTLRNLNGDIAVGLDVGTTKICAIVGKNVSERTEISGIGLSPSSGLRKGIVVDIDMAVSSIRKALKEAEDMAGFRITSVYAGIAGGHIKGFNGYGAIDIKGRKVAEDDIERLIDSASAVYVPVDRDILHVIPAGFKLSGHNGIKNPVGMYGDRLEAKVHIVTGSVAPVQNLIRCCEMAGVEVADILLEPLASADSVLNADEKETGVALIDIGGGTTDIAVYRDGVLRHTAILALGGNHITNDIAVGLGVSVSEAEKLKKSYGSMSVCKDIGAARELIDIPGTNGKARKVDAGYLAEIIDARCEEIIGLVRKELGIAAGEESQFVPRISSVVITGGTSLLKGLREFTESALGFPVKIGLPEGLRDKGLVNSPVFATGVGLVRYGLDQLEKGGGTELPPLTSAGIFEHMRQWVSYFFNKQKTA